MFVYQVVTTSSDGSMNHHPTLFRHRSKAKRYAESIRDLEWAASNGYERWNVRIDRMKVDEEE